ncbi:MAG: hypothetical protein WCV84_04130 [Patescibacteria group bacterium]
MGQPMQPSNNESSPSPKSRITTENYKRVDGFTWIAVSLASFYPLGFAELQSRGANKTFLWILATAAIIHLLGTSVVLAWIHDYHVQQRIHKDLKQAREQREVLDAKTAEASAHSWFAFAHLILNPLLLGGLFWLAFIKHPHGLFIGRAVGIILIVCGLSIPLIRLALYQHRTEKQPPRHNAL